MNPTLRRVLVVLAVLVLILVLISVVARATHESADCTGGPVTHEGSSSTFDVRCTVPNTQTTTTVPGPTVTEPAPPPVTVTATETVTVTPSPTAPTSTPPTSTPPPAEPETVWGASVAGTSNTGQAVVTKFGYPRVYVRQFFGSGADSTPPLRWPTPPAGVLMHRSYKPSPSITNAQIDALLLAARGHWVTFWHESDNDTNLDTTAERTERVNLQNRLYDRNVALGRPATVVPTFTGWMFSDGTTDAYRKDYWRDVKGDLLGVDLDGVHNYTTDYDDEIAEALDWLEDNPEYEGWAAPEFGTSRQASDSTGSGRTAWMREQVGYMEAAEPKPAGVAWYDYNSTTGNSIEPGQPEFNYWRELIASNP